MEEPLRERLSEWIATAGRRQLAAVAIVGALTVAGAVFWYVRSLPKPVAITSTAGGSGGDAVPTAAPSPATIVVDVAGWVQHPGVYDFAQGDRVIDAIRRAGGARPGAELTALNLAALLTDAQQVLVPRRAPAGGGTAVPGAGGAGADAKVNLNTATLDQLESLPGIGPVLAQRILDHRTEHGPFTSIDELKDVSGIGEKRFADLEPHVTV